MLACWLAGCVPFFFFFFWKETMKTSPNHVTIPKTLTQPRYLPTLPGYNRVTHYTHTFKKIKVALFRTHVTVTEPFVYTHPLLSRGYPAKTNPFFFFFYYYSYYYYYFSRSLPRSLGPSNQHCTALFREGKKKIKK